MHIAYFTNTYFPVMSGVVRSVSTFRQALAGMGHNVFVFAQEAPEFEDTEPFIFRYPSVDLGLPGDVPAIIPLSNFIDRLFPALKVDIVHSHHPFLLGQAAANKAEKYNLPLVFTFHSRYREYSQYVPLTQNVVQEIVRGVIDNILANYLRRCQHIIVPTESIRQMLVDDYGISSGVTIIPTGIDLELYQSADGRHVRQQNGWQNERILVSVGRLAREKNWETLLAAMQIVAQSHPATRLVILGDGDERDNLENLAYQLGIFSQITFVGRIPFEQIPAYLKAADLFCFSSVNETQGLVTLEAMAAGLPVVAVDATGTRDLIHDGCEGLLTENDAQALASAICQALENEPLLTSLKAAAAEKAKSFAIEELAKDMLNVYQEAIEARRLGQSIRVERDGWSLV